MEKTGNQKKLSNVKENYNGIDLGKYILAFFVIAIHYHPLTSVNTTVDYYIVNYIARIAVPFYFIASGFLCFRKTEYNAFDIRVPLKYAWKILKLYIIWSMIYFIPALIDLYRVYGRIGTSMLKWMHNFLFSSSFRQLWYLKATAFAVVLVAFLVNKKWKPKAIIAFAAVFYCLGLMGQSYFGLLRILITDPCVWSAFDFLGNVFVTTRNGLFDGFVFVAIGAMIAFETTELKKNHLIAGFALSILILFFEVYITRQLGWVREYDMYIMLIPSSYFAFNIAVNAPIPNNPVFKEMRETSSLLYYLHTLVGWRIKRWISFLARYIAITQINSLVLYLIVVVFSYMFALLIKHLSKHEKFRWLRVIYK